MTIRLGAYLLPGDPVWLASSLSRYYDRLDDLVVLVPEGGIGWAGRKIPVDQCLALIERCDTKSIRRIVTGSWVDAQDPMRADTAQRQAGLDALAGRVDWVLQIDNDEVLPDVDRLLSLVDQADELALEGVEWPLRVLYRALGPTRFLEVSGADGQTSFEYPGPVLVRARARLSDARRTSGAFLRATVAGDRASLQLQRPPEKGEHRIACLGVDDAIWHNSWGRPAGAVRRKVSTWGHTAGWRSRLYYWLQWYPSPLTWRLMRDFHPFARGLWQRLRPVEVPSELLDPVDR